MWHLCEWFAVTFPMRVAVGQSEMQMTMSMYEMQTNLDKDFLWLHEQISHKLMFFLFTT